MSRPRDKRLPYLPGIDALRAIAVLAVFAYHAGIGWMPGGFLGVDVFFVISGYLITSLLLSEYRRGGHVKLGRFWLRRARRLLPVSLPRGVLIPLQLLLVLVLADLSYRFVELPFRGKAKLPALPDGWLRVARPALAVAVVAIVVGVGWSGIISTGSRHLEAGVAAASTAPFAKVTVKPSAHRSPRVVAFGDSVMIGAKERLAARFGPRFSMNAKEGRQAGEFAELARRLKRRGGNVDDLIVQMGDNGPLYGDEMEALREATANVGELFLVNDHAPVSWVGESNHALAEADATWPHTTLIDWSAVASGREGLFWDGIHLTPAGAGVYTRLLVHSVRSAGTPAKPQG
jgi:lysophospholipase L1-like esterase